MTAMIIPSTPGGGPPGGSAKKKTKIASPIPAIVPRAMPPSRAPMRIQAKKMMSSSAILIYDWMTCQKPDREGGHLPHRNALANWRASETQLRDPISIAIKQILNLLLASRLQQRQR